MLNEGTIKAKNYIDQQQNQQRLRLFLNEYNPQQFSQIFYAFIWTKQQLRESNLSYMFQQDNFQKLSQKFKKQFMINQNISTINALDIIYRAGKIFQKQQAQFNTNYKIKNQQLPFEFNLGEEFQFHSILLCPVSKQICSPENPPKILKCGHVISKISFEKISNKKKLKCPLCSIEQDISEVIQMIF